MLVRSDAAARRGIVSGRTESKRQVRLKAQDIRRIASNDVLWWCGMSADLPDQRHGRTRDIGAGAGCEGHKSTFGNTSRIAPSAAVWRVIHFQCKSRWDSQKLDH